jgi:hypothetical protein
MVQRLFPMKVLAFLGLGAALAFVIGIVGAALRHDSAGNVLLSALEAAILAFAGGLLARSFISLLLWTGRDNDTVGFVLGWAFFLWPGLVDTFPKLIAGKQYATRPVVLLWIAASVGAFTGMMDGLWQTHNWIGPGVVAFALDETWGLNGSTEGDILHLVNFTWGDHVVGETRTDAHRYNKGFAVQSGFAFTQGAVMSNNTSAAGTPLFNHENTHVWQNRIFGPLFTFSYIAWLLVFLIPGLIAAAITGSGSAIENVAYVSNPWEVWAYAVQGLDRTTFGPAVMPGFLVVILSILFYPAFLYLLWRIVRPVWTRARAGV